MIRIVFVSSLLLTLSSCVSFQLGFNAMHSAIEVFKYVKPKLEKEKDQNVSDRPIPEDSREKDTTEDRTDQNSNN